MLIFATSPLRPEAVYSTTKATQTTETTELHVWTQQKEPAVMGNESFSAEAKLHSKKHFFL